MKNTYPFYIIFEVLKVLLAKIYKIQPPVLLFAVLHQLLHQQIYHFSSTPPLIPKTTSNMGNSYETDSVKYLGKKIDKKLNQKAHYWAIAEGVGRTYFLKKKTLTFLGFSLYPWRFQTKQSFTPRNSTRLCYTPQKF